MFGIRVGLRNCRSVGPAYRLYVPAPQGVIVGKVRTMPSSQSCGGGSRGLARHRQGSVPVASSRPPSHQYRHIESNIGRPTRYLEYVLIAKVSHSLNQGM